MASNDLASDARAVAHEAISQILRRRIALDDALSLDGIEEARDRAFARLLTATTLRRKGQIDQVLGKFLEKSPPPAIEDVLRLAAAQLLFLETPPHAVVDRSVDLAKKLGLPAFAPLVNAVLRRISTEGAALVAAQDESRLNVPDWLWQQWSAAYGDKTAQAIALAHLAEPPLDLTPLYDEWAERLSAETLFTGSLRLEKGGAVEKLPGYEEGGCWVQDAAATLPARLLKPKAGEHIADLCAAPGGKTAQLAAAGAVVTALDRSARRLTRLSENLARLKLDATTVVADAAAWQPPHLFDKILLDAPCSATGTLRRHPDVAWSKQPDDIVKLAATQDRLLAAAGAMLKPGGILLFCTCSLQPEEGAARIEPLLKDTKYRRLPVRAEEVGGLGQLISPQGDLRTLPCHLAEIGGMDGFFAARLQKIE